MGSKSQYLQIRVSPHQKERIRRLAAASGQDISSYVLMRALPAAQERFEELVEMLGQKGEDSYVLAELNDLLSSLGPEELRDAVAHGPPERLSPYLRNYVAAMVEQACMRRHVRAPDWTAAIPPLDGPRFAAPLASLRLHLLRSSPVPYKRRNIFVDSSVGDRI